MLVKTFSPEEVKALLDGSIFKQIEEDWIAASQQIFPFRKAHRCWWVGQR